MVFPILLVASMGISDGPYLYKKAENMMADLTMKIAMENQILRDKKVNPNIDNVSILFIGIDGSEKRGTGDSTRSDALMLATLNEKGEISKASFTIPRDSYVISV